MHKRRLYIRAEPRTTHPSMIFFVVFTPLNWIKRDRDTEITIDVVARLTLDRIPNGIFAI